MIATMAVPAVASGLSTYVVVRRSREFRGASAIVADRQGLPNGAYLDFRGVAGFDQSIAAARLRTAAR